MPRPLLTPRKDAVPIGQGLGGPQGRCGQVRKISPPPGFDPRTVQPVASRYTDYAIRPTLKDMSTRNTSWGQRRPLPKVDDLTTFMYRLS